MEKMKDLIIRALQKVSGVTEIYLEFSENEDFGDYSTNIAMTMLDNAKWKTPREYAQTIVEKLKKDKTLNNSISKIKVAGGGFINFFLSQEALTDELNRIINEKEKYGSSSLGEGKTVIVDYSSPNIAKRFGIGHVRSTVIGQAIYNLYKSLGYKVIGDNHLGDWGTQFGTLLFQISNLKLQISNLTVDKLQELYVQFHKEADKNPELWDEARAWFKKLEDKDKKARELWKAMVDISMEEFNRIYKLLGVKIDYAYGESFYEDYMPKVIETLHEKKLSSESRGAEIVEFPPANSGQLPPAMLVKSDGATTYFTRDLATILFRIGSWNPQLIIYEVGSEQTLHFRQVFEAARLLGWGKNRKFVHIRHGLIRFEHGKMSTRKGETIELEKVLREAIDRAKRIIEKSETSRGLSTKEKKEVAKAVGIGAVKYFDLSHHPTTDIIFDWEKMFLLEGNSAPYLQYTVARTNSVLAKARSTKHEARKSFEFRISNFEFNSEELGVLRSLARFPETISLAAKNYSPNLLCNYLFDLAQKYNNFYAHHRILNSERKKNEILSDNQHRIIGAENEGFRLLLTSGVGQVLKTGLGILGIETPQRM